MNYKIYEELINCFKLNKDIDSKIIKNCIKKYLAIKKYEGYVTEVVFNREKVAAYDESGRIYLDYKNFEWPDDYNYDEFNDDMKKYVSDFNRIDVILSLLHELVHAEQQFFSERKIKIFNNKFIDFEFNKALKYGVDNYDLYDKFHDFYLHEYYANTRSSLRLEENVLNKVQNLISKNVLYDHNCEVANDILDSYLDFDGEKISYPLLNNHLLYPNDNTEEYNDKNFEEEVKKLAKIKNNDFEKIMMGLPISDDTLEYIEEVATEKILTKNLFADLKKL